MISAFRLSLFLLFQSTLPAGERHRHQNRCAIPICISIHAPRGGSDHQRRSNINPAAYFNPRSPRGERPDFFLVQFRLFFPFQSTLPAGGATRLPPQPACCRTISIHAPRGGSDFQKDFAFACGEIISIHAPRGGSDPRSETLLNRTRPLSIHAPRGGSDDRFAG